jgi:hypothetical protein
MHNPPRRVRARRRRIGPGLVTRHADGTCEFTCYTCQSWSNGHHWRAMLRLARNHAADHRMQARYGLTPQGDRLVGHSGPRWRRRLALAGAALVLAVVAFAATVAGMASRAAPAPVPSIGIITTTTTTAAPSSSAAPATTGYRPTVAGPPATNAQGQWIEPDPATSTSSSAGGGR